MKSREYLNINRERSNLAWNRLYKRLQEDQLLEEKSESQVSIVKTRWISIAAMLIFVLASGYILHHFIRHDLVEESNMITLSNSGESLLAVRLQDGTIILLNKDASVSYPEEFAADKREIEFSGDAFFEIAKNPYVPFLIRTSDAVVKVLGTSFNINCTSGQPFEMHVKNGLVEVESLKNKETLRVKAGERLLVNESNFLLTNNIDLAFFDKYHKNLRFKDASLSDIISILNNNNSQKIILQKEELGDKQLTLELREYTPESAAQIISLALNLGCIVSEEQILITE